MRGRNPGNGGAGHRTPLMERKRELTPARGTRGHRTSRTKGGGININKEKNNK